ncbi:MAG: PfkB family carbohydrate kinase [Clostridia bacterium]|jgi:fructose-1-phosphate kinase PfkB-like protein|nr:PfkB family carbohydrate kinase [Clostridia bacterium]
MITVTEFSPEIDEIYKLRSLKAGEENSVKEYKIEVSGKGIKIGKNLKVLKAEPYIVGCLGGYSGKIIRSDLNKLKIKSDFVWLDGEVKLNSKLMLGNEIFTLVKEEPDIDEAKTRQVVRKTLNKIKDSSVIVMTETLPATLHYHIYKKIIKDARKYNVKSIVELSKDTYKLIDSNPYLIFAKEENLNLLNVREGHLIDDLLSYIKDGIHYIVVKMKDNSTVVISKNQVFKADIENFVAEFPSAEGVKEAYMAGLAFSLEKKYEMEKMIKLAAAMEYSVLTTGEKVVNNAEVRKLYKKVKIDKIHNKEEVKELIRGYCDV